ncbi:TRAP transporter small permease subunit [Bilophila wadsworthia]|uniref:TRAP transporter small permease subunit n=1 Tax=Bilophila wadsworthia TaxID=35833 RepID=UPI00242D3AD8|nr:TRAP transporter small permease subunit [Bilophila wadsworthia]
MNRILEIIDAVNTKIGEWISIIIIIMTFIIMFEVCARYFFASPTIWATEVVTIIYGFYIILGGAYTYLKGQHVNIDFLWCRFSRRTQAMVGLFTNLFALLFLAVMVISGWEKALQSYAINEVQYTPLGSPVWPTKFCLVLGAALFLLQLAAHMLSDIQYLMNGKEEGRRTS